MTSAPSDTRFSAIPRTAAQTRVLDAALRLIAERGVSGTSLQMIADAMGVTKAAVYRQFKTKEEIVVAITEREMARLEDAVEAAPRSQPLPSKADAPPHAQAAEDEEELADWEKPQNFDQQAVPAKVPTARGVTNLRARLMSRGF